jgi:tetratricopeptide (TPR) repeat protein
MRVRRACTEHELELQLIHESPLELTFQHGNIPQPTLMKAAKTNLFVYILVLVVLAVGIRFGSLIIFNSFDNFTRFLQHSHPQFLILIVVIPIIPLIYILYAPYFTVWILERTNNHLVQIKTNLLGKKQKRKFDFSDIKAIKVEDEYDSDFPNSQCIELYLVLQSGKEITLSQSSYESNRRKRAIALKYHREIAEKMRSCIGFNNEAIPNNERAEAVYIPSEEEINQELAVGRKLARQVFTTLFSSKTKKEKIIQELRFQVNQKPTNPFAWENLAMMLDLQQDRRLECIEAYRRAETLYSQQGDIGKVRQIKAIIKRLMSEKN